MILKYFKKYGGIKIIKDYINNHILIYSIIVLLIIPKNKTGLELFNEIITTKKFMSIKRWVKKQRTYEYSLELSVKPKIIWFCWYQGLDAAPELVKRAFNQLSLVLPDYKIVLLTKDNIEKYTELPDYIIDKWNKGKISNAHFSDILRTNLLCIHGGTWIDSTALLTDSIPQNIYEANFFIFRNYKPGTIGHSITTSSWFISSIKKHPILLYVQDLLFQYWKDNNTLKDYFLFHYFIEIGIEKYAELLKYMPIYTNEEPHLLFYELNKKFDQDKYEVIKKRTFIHKLSNKEEYVQGPTFYNEILRNN